MLRSKKNLFLLVGTLVFLLTIGLFTTKSSAASYGIKKSIVSGSASKGNSVMKIQVYKKDGSKKVNIASTKVKGNQAYIALKDKNFLYINYGYGWMTNAKIFNISKKKFTNAPSIRGDEEDMKKANGYYLVKAFRTGADGVPLYLVDAKNIKVKKVTSNVLDGKRLGNKYYFTKNNNQYLYRCNANGKSLTKVKKLTVPSLANDKNYNGGSLQIGIEKTTNNYIKYYTNCYNKKGKLCKYTYKYYLKTGKIKKI